MKPLNELTPEQVYLIYFNDYLTVDKMAEHHEIEPADLDKIIRQGRADHYKKHGIERPTNINTGVCQWRATNNKPPFFVNWQEDGKNHYKYFPIVSSMYKYKERLEARA